MVAAQNLTKNASALTYVPLIVSLFIFSCSFFVQRFFPAFNSFKKVAVSYISLGFIGLLWFQGCAGSGPAASNTQLVNGGETNFIQPASQSVFFARVPRNGLVEIPLPDGMTEFSRTYSAPLSQGGYFISEFGDDTALTGAKVPSYALPALNYKIENGILKIEETSEATVYLFESDKASITVAVQTPIAAALGAVRKDILPIENPDPILIQQAFDQAIANYNLKGLTMKLRTVGNRKVVEVSDATGPKGVVQLLKDDDRKQLTTLDDARMTFLGSKTPEPSVPPGPSPAQVQAFNQSLKIVSGQVSNIKPSGGVNSEIPVAAPTFDEPKSIVDALGWTKWEAYNGFSSAEINLLKLHLWAVNDVGNIDQLLGDVDSKQIGPKLFDNPSDPIIPLLAKTKVLQDSKGVFFNATRLNDPLYKSGSLLERDPRPTGNIAEAIINFHKAGTKFQVASKGAIFLGPTLTISDIQRKHTSNPQGPVDLKMPDGYEDASPTQTNEYWGLFYFSSVEEALAQAKNLNDAVKNLFGTDPDSKFLQLGHDYLAGLNQLNFTRTGDQRCEVYSDDPNTIYPEASIALMGGAPILKDHIRLASRECGSYSQGYPTKRAFPWMYGEDFAIVQPTAGGGGRVMVLMKSTLNTNYQSVESNPYASWIVLKLYNDGFFNPSKDLSSTLVQAAPRNYFYNSEDGEFDLAAFMNEIKDISLEFHFHRDPKPAIYKRAATPTASELDKAMSVDRTGLYQKVSLNLPVEGNQPDSALQMIPYGNSYAFAIFRRQKLECSNSDLAQKSERYWGSVQQIWDVDDRATYDIKPEPGLGCYSTPPTPSGLGLSVTWIDNGGLYKEGNPADPDGYKNCTTNGIDYASDFVNPHATLPGLRNDVCDYPESESYEDDIAGGELSNQKFYDAEYTCQECWTNDNTTLTKPCRGRFRIPRREIPLLPEYYYLCDRKSASSACLGVAGFLIYDRIDLMTDVGLPPDPKMCDAQCAGGMSSSCEACKRSLTLLQQDYHTYVQERLIGQVSAFRDYAVTSGATSTGKYKLEVWGAPSTGGSYTCSNTCAWPEPNQIIPMSDDWIEYVSRYDRRLKPPEPRSNYEFLTATEVWNLRRPQLTAALPENASAEQVQARDRMRTYFDLISIYFENNQTSVTGARSTPGGTNGNGGGHQTERELPSFGHLTLSNSNLLVDYQAKYFNGQSDEYSYLENFKPRIYQWFPGGFSDWDTIRTIGSDEFDGAHAGLFDAFYLNFHLNNKWKAGFSSPFGVQADRLHATDNELWGGSVSVPAIGRYTLNMHAKEIFEYPNGIPSLAMGTYSQAEKYAPRLEYWLIDELRGLDSSLQPSTLRAFINPMPTYPEFGKLFFDYFQQEEPPVHGTMRKAAQYQLAYHISGFRDSWGEAFSPTAVAAPKLTRIGNYAKAYPKNMLTPSLMEQELLMPAPLKLLSSRSRLQRAIDMKRLYDATGNPDYFYFGQVWLDIGGGYYLPFIDFADQNYETQDVCPGCDDGMLASEVNPCERHKRNEAGDTCWWCSVGSNERTYFCDWPPPADVPMGVSCGAWMEDPFPWTNVDFWSSGARLHCSVGTSLRYGAGDNTVKRPCEKADADQCGARASSGYYLGADPDATTDAQLKGKFDWADESPSCSPCPNLWTPGYSPTVKPKTILKTVQTNTGASPIE